MDVFVPRTLGDAVAARVDHPEATPVAGGTDLMVAVNFGRFAPYALLDLSRVEELQSVRRDDGTVFAGAGVTFARIGRELPGPLADAARTVGSPQVRNRATLGGNLVTASPAGDSIPVLAAWDADVVVARTGGVRRVRWEDFLLGPKRTALGPDELVVGAEWKAPRGPASFAKVGPRNAMVIAVASACLQLDEDAHTVRLALGSVAPTVIRARTAERFANELDWDAPDASALREFGRLAAADARPIDDVRGTAAYRRHVVSVLARRALQRALEERC